MGKRKGIIPPIILKAPGGYYVPGMGTYNPRPNPRPKSKLSLLIILLISLCNTLIRNKIKFRIFL